MKCDASYRLVIASDCTRGSLMIAHAQRQPSPNAQSDDAPLHKKTTAASRTLSSRPRQRHRRKEDPPKAKAAISSRIAAFLPLTTNHFLFGTFAPFFRASESPIAIACLRLVTFCPLPLFSFPRLNSCISVSTCLPADLLYLRVDDFLAAFF